MENRQLRILILDSVHAQSMQLEKMLNMMGYYCIATASSLDEGISLSFAGPKTFDVLLAAEPMLGQQHCQSATFEKFEISNLFAYSCSSNGPEVQQSVKGNGCYRSGMPEYTVLEQFISRLVPAPGDFRRTTRDWRLACSDEYLAVRCPIKLCGAFCAVWVIVLRVRQPSMHCLTSEVSPLQRSPLRPLLSDTGRWKKH